MVSRKKAARPKLGRPPKPADEKQRHRLQGAFTDDERAELEAVLEPGETRPKQPPPHHSHSY